MKNVTIIYKLCKDIDPKLHNPLIDHLTPKTSPNVFNQIDHKLYAKIYNILRTQIRSRIRDAIYDLLEPQKY